MIFPLGIVFRVCHKCYGINSRRSHKWCNDCHNAYMREWRKTHPLTKEQRRKGNARAYANEYKRRGKIQKETCRKCGSEESQMHHPDYDEPLLVEWYCRKCHMELHRRAS